MTIQELETLLKIERDKEKQETNKLITQQKIAFLAKNNIPLGKRVVGTCGNDFIFDGVISLVNEKDNNPNIQCIHVEGHFARFSESFEHEVSVWKGDLGFDYTKINLINDSFKQAILNKVDAYVTNRLETTC